MKEKATILNIDDDENLQFVVKEYMESEGYRVLRAHNLKEFQTWCGQGSAIDIVLLDLVLKDAEGLSLISVIRDKIRAPIIVVSGKTDTTEKIVCLEMGADDYITKPFEMRELMARIKAVMRRGSPVEPAAAASNQLTQPNASHVDKTGRLSFGKWILDTDQYKVTTKKGTDIDLTTGEFRLLEALVSSAGKVLSREHLFDITRPGNRFDSFDRAIDIQIARVRRKLGDSATNSDEVIKTIRGVGYMINTKVEKL